MKLTETTNFEEVSFSENVTERLRLQRIWQIQCRWNIQGAVSQNENVPSYGKLDNSPILANKKKNQLYLEISSPGAVNDWGFGGLSGVLSPVVEGMVK